MQTKRLPKAALFCFLKAESQKAEKALTIPGLSKNEAFPTLIKISRESLNLAVARNTAVSTTQKLKFTQTIIAKKAKLQC